MESHSVANTERERSVGQKLITEGFIAFPCIWCSPRRNKFTYNVPTLINVHLLKRTLLYSAAFKKVEYNVDQPYFSYGGPKKISTA